VKQLEMRSGNLIAVCRRTDHIRNRTIRTELKIFHVRSKTVDHMDWFSPVEMMEENTKAENKENQF
jgi:hypothetical protein